MSINSKRHDLDKYFSKFGKIRDIEINEKKGTAFIKFEDPDSAKHAVDEMDGRNYEGARVKVDFKRTNFRFLIIYFLPKFYSYSYIYIYNFFFLPL